MDITFRLIQSGSIIHGVYWGNFLSTKNLIVVKSRIIEAYEVNEEAKSLYCILEQDLAYSVRVLGC